MDKIVLLGGGGYCAGVIDSIRAEGKYEIIGITDPLDKGEHCGVKILGNDEILPELYRQGVRYAHVTVGSIARPTVRVKLIQMAKEIGFELVSIVDPTAIVSNNTEIGEMVYVAKGAIVNSTAKIGNYCMINTGCIVEHGCVLGDWVHIAPGAVLAADITIGDRSHVGINASLLQGISIGKDVIIGAGSTVIGNVEDDKTVYGIVKGYK